MSCLTNLVFSVTQQNRIHRASKGKQSCKGKVIIESDNGNEMQYKGMNLLKVFKILFLNHIGIFEYLASGTTNWKMHSQKLGQTQ